MCRFLLPESANSRGRDGNRQEAQQNADGYPNSHSARKNGDFSDY
jgi:hypothetical protein